MYCLSAFLGKLKINLFNAKKNEVCRSEMLKLGRKGKLFYNISDVKVIFYVISSSVKGLCVGKEVYGIHRGSLFTTKY